MREIKTRSNQVFDFNTLNKVAQPKNKNAALCLSSVHFEMCSVKIQPSKHGGKNPYQNGVIFKFVRGFGKAYSDRI